MSPEGQSERSARDHLAMNDLRVSALVCCGIGTAADTVHEGMKDVEPWPE